MKLSELTEQQQKDQNLFVISVQDTGWELDPGTEKMLTNDISVSPEALAKIWYGVLIYQIVRSASGENFSHLYLYYDDLAPLLELLLTEAPKVIPETYPDMVSKLMQLCKMVVMVTEDQLYRIS